MTHLWREVLLLCYCYQVLNKVLLVDEFRLVSTLKSCNFVTCIVYMVDRSIWIFGLPLILFTIKSFTLKLFEEFVQSKIKLDILKLHLFVQVIVFQLYYLSFILSIPIFVLLNLGLDLWFLLFFCSIFLLGVSFAFFDFVLFYGIF